MPNFNLCWSSPWYTQYTCLLSKATESLLSTTSLLPLAPCWWILPTAVKCDFLFFIQAVDSKISVLLGFPHCSFCNVSSSWDFMLAGYYRFWVFISFGDFYLEPQKQKSDILPLFRLSIHTFEKGFETICGHAWYTVSFSFVVLLPSFKKINWTLLCGHLCSAEWQSNWPLKYTYHRFHCDVGIHS